jgi:hypothetical protein
MLISVNFCVQTERVYSLTPTHQYQHYHHHHHQQQQPQQVPMAHRHHSRSYYPGPVDGDVTQSSPAAPSADTDSSSGCWSSNDVTPCSSTGSPNGASRYQVIAERPPVIETDMDAVLLNERNSTTVASNGASGKCCSCVGCHGDANVGLLSRDIGGTGTACVSRGNGYCCSVQPLVTSPAITTSVSYDKNDLPPPPSPLASVNNNDGLSAREFRCSGDDDVAEREQFLSAENANGTASSSSARCRQPPPLPPPRRTSSLVQQKNR